MDEELLVCQESPAHSQGIPRSNGNSSRNYQLMDADSDRQDQYVLKNPLISNNPWKSNSKCSCPWMSILSNLNVKTWSGPIKNFISIYPKKAPKNLMRPFFKVNWLLSYLSMIFFLFSPWTYQLYETELLFNEQQLC
jgi:hypothetical protein